MAPSSRKRVRRAIVLDNPFSPSVLAWRAGSSSPYTLFGQGVGLGTQDADPAVGAFGHAAVGMAVDADLEPFDAVFLGDALGRLYFLPCVASVDLFALRHHGLLTGRDGRAPIHWVNFYECLQMPRVERLRAQGAGQVVHSGVGPVGSERSSTRHHACSRDMEPPGPLCRSNACLPLLLHVCDTWPPPVPLGIELCRFRAVVGIPGLNACAHRGLARCCRGR